jgi:hypothetical protein
MHGCDARWLYSIIFNWELSMSMKQSLRQLVCPFPRVHLPDWLRASCCSARSRWFCHSQSTSYLRHVDFLAQLIRMFRSPRICARICLALDIYFIPFLFVLCSGSSSTLWEVIWSSSYTKSRPLEATRSLRVTTAFPRLLSYVKAIEKN